MIGAKHYRGNVTKLEFRQLQPGAGQTPWMEAEPRAQVGRGNIKPLAALAGLRQDLEAIGPNLNARMRLIAERALDLTRATGAAIAQSQGDEMVCVATAGSDAPALGARV